MKLAGVRASENSPFGFRSDPPTLLMHYSSAREIKMAEAKKVLTVRDLAAKHKVNPKNLRALLRRHKMSPKKDGHYEWPEGDAALTKIAQLIVDDVPAKKH